MRVVVLGAGFAGLELTTRLSDEFGTDIEVVLIDRTDSFVFGFSKLEVMFGRAVPSGVRHSYGDLVKPGVRFVQANIDVDRSGREASCDRQRCVRGRHPRRGARRRPRARARHPGLIEGGYEFYTEEGAFALRDVLAASPGGG